jgi:hypothetical protein
LQRRLIGQNAFRNDRIGANNAIKRTLEMLINEGSLQQISPGDMARHFNTNAKGFVVTNLERFIPKKSLLFGKS